jgi:DHA3 family macrolide efflux protein-like MFS transporter
LLLVDVLGAVVSVLMLMIITIPESKVVHSATHVLADAKFGFSRLMSNKGIWYVTLIGTVFMFLFMPAVSMYPLMTMGYFHGTVFQAGVVEVIYSAGMLLGGAFIGIFGKWKNRMPLVLFSFFGVGITYGISGFLTGDFRGFVAFVVLNAAGGMVSSLFNILYMAVVQQSYPPEELGRVMSVMNSFMSAAGPIGLVFAGPVADAIGVEKLFLIAGIGGVVCGVAALASSSVRNIDRELHKRLDAAPSEKMRE